jgi:hypothetical protein
MHSAVASTLRTSDHWLQIDNKKAPWLMPKVLLGIEVVGANGVEPLTYAL